MARLGTLLPPLEWAPRYRRAWLADDAVAGLTLAAYAIPVSLAYSTLAGLPPHHGVYCYLAGGLGYALFGTSRQLAIGPTSAIAMLVGTTVAGLAAGDAQRWIAVAALAGLTVAGMAWLAWFLRLSGLVNFISETILLGFKAGAALTIALTQLPKLFGVPGGGDSFASRLAILIGQLGQTHGLVLLIGLAAIALLYAGDKLFPGRPLALGVVVCSIVISSLLGFAAQGVEVVGPLPAGLPELRWPSLKLRDVDGVLPLAAACFLLAYVEGVSAARTLATKHGYTIDSRQELLALGAANFAAAFAQGFPVAGGLSQSAVNDKAGARTPLALIFASGAIALCLLFLTSLLEDLPSVVLAAIVLVAVAGLFDVRALVKLCRVSRSEFAVSVVALVGVLLLGILKGVLVAVVISLLMLVAAAARPHVAFLGRIPGTRRYSDLARHPDNERIPGVLIFRVEAPLLYFNVEHVRHEVAGRLAESGPLRLVVCDLSNSPTVDTAGAAMLAALQRELAESKVALRVVEAHGKTRDLLRAVGLEAQIGYLGRRLSVDQVIAEALTPSAGEPPRAPREP